MTVMEDIANVIRSGACVVMGMGVAPEKYRLLLQDATNQDYIVIGSKYSQDVKFIASRMGGEILGPHSLSISGMEMTVYFVRNIGGEQAM